MKSLTDFIFAFFLENNRKLLHSTIVSTRSIQQHQILHHKITFSIQLVGTFWKMLFRDTMPAYLLMARQVSDFYIHIILSKISKKFPYNLPQSFPNKLSQTAGSIKDYQNFSNNVNLINLLPFDKLTF
jgi:hypothetical protein